MVQKPLRLDSFHLKLIALLTMLIDHTGVIVVGSFWPGSVIYSILRIIGRIAFPLFAFMIAEGVVHSKKPWLYLLRIAFMGVLIGTSMYVIDEFMGISVLAGNIFVDLLLGGSIIYALRQKGYWKLTAIVPIALTIAIFVFRADLPAPVKMDYQIYGIVMMVGFYLARVAGNWYLRKITSDHGISFVGFTLTEQYQRQLNLYSSIWLLSVNLIWYIISLVDSSLVHVYMGAQTYAIMAAFFIYMYTGKRGYNKKWFQYGSYAFYPLHFLLLFGVYQLLLLIMN